MNLTHTLHYLRTGHISVQKIEVVEELSAECNSYGVSAVRKYIKETLGSSPLIVKVVEKGRQNQQLYFFKRVCFKYPMHINGNIINVYSYKNYTMVNRAGAIYSGHSFYSVYSSNSRTYYLFEVDRNSPVYYNYSVEEWIAFGGECDECGTSYIDYNLTNNNEHVCQTCIQNYQVRSYSHKVEDELGFEETDDIVFGVELEYENVSARDVFKTLKGHALPKRDGSIIDGVEIVTRPARMKSHKQKLENFFNAIKVKSEPNTGMHVHIERKKLSQFQIGFIMEFLNKKHLSEHLVKIAGRDYRINSYTRSNEIYTMTYGVYYDNKYNKLLRNPTDKYSPLNTSKPSTVEIRIFSSPETAEECFAKLDFVEALVKYSSPYSVHVKSLKEKFNWDTFTKFMIEHKKDYPHYNNYFLKGNN